MSSRFSILVLVVLSVLCGVLARGYLPGSECDSPDASDLELARLGSSIVSQQQLVRRDLEHLGALRPRTDSILMNRSRLRASLNTGTRRDSTVGQSSAASKNAVTLLPRVIHMIRVDDRLVAELVMERRSSRKLQNDYKELLTSYARQQEVSSDRLLLMRRAEKRRRRRTIVTTAAVTALATYLIAK